MIIIRVLIYGPVIIQTYYNLVIFHPSCNTVQSLFGNPRKKNPLFRGDFEFKSKEGLPLNYIVPCPE
jgi:hypothetical protein